MRPKTTVDLSHAITPLMPLYPGSDPPVIIPVSSINSQGYLEQRISFDSHTGTHVDAPAHLLEGGLTLDRMEADRFMGTGLILDFRGHGRPFIELFDLKPWIGRMESSDFLLFHTGWSRHWGTAAYFEGYPVLSQEAARWISGLNLKGTGFDLISPDPIGSTDLAVHRILLGQNRIIVENLTNLELLPAVPFLFCCLPLKVAGAEGFPVRAVAVL